MDDLVLEALSRGPLTSTQLVAAVSTESSELFAGREGLVFPILLSLRRRGLVRNEWVDAGPGRRDVHGLPDADFAAATPPAAHVGPAAERLLCAADDATRRLGFAPRLRDELRNDVLAHLRDSAAARTAAGAASSDAAEKEAVRALGDPWKIGVDLARTAQGMRTVVFPHRVRDSLAGVAIYDLRVLLVILAAIVFVRVQVVTAYHIPTKSMEPTLHGDQKHGDRILVNKLSGEPRRFDITVFDGWGEDRKNYVKRCVGLPGEKLDLHEGDLYVDDRLVRKDDDFYEALLFEVFDRARETARAKSRSQDPVAAEAWFRKDMQELWKFEGEGQCGLQEDKAAPFAGFRLSASDTPGASPPQVAWHEGVEDGFVDPETGEWRPGAYAVPDLRITASVKRVPGAAATVVLRLTRGEAGTYDARFENGRVELLVDGAPVAHRDGVELPEGVPTEVAFSQVDYVLRVAVRGEIVLRHEMPQPGAPKRAGGPGAAVVRVVRGAAWIDPLRLERDVYYVAGEGPEENLARLGPDQFFMLGDNSSNSSDSRMHGPVHRSRLIGRPLLVVWPLDRVHVPK